MIKLWLICYDVKDDKRRTQLAKLLEQHCERVQYSVFECPLDVKKLEHLLSTRWLKVLNLQEDSLRIYPLDASAKQKIKIYGLKDNPPYESPDYLIL
ncbi:CRISPR-associated endonuclease Cas2 [Cyanobacterium aponinum UTEX 3222]|uniref:CRISPR-associated endoribonuclease Cas2 n=3 Tax=Cyanobacterium aponinum TaxID=379064 RepID=K9Z1J1_CYAAP|nr:CRISPR-associated endonuclease Cas2 [Cyanobacterium aponinum]WRL41049.1 CRISPR-associated endonuclease Cas2 [Cyanobacterium aponinum UTEX 3222]AFZ53076.1 CRISPR-associated protein, Cas2 family [Cyanobacterium aponinum PCC 10605]MBD2393621.1 CRISPR-associated endonuclease Cas2 [Cyanobacterium aponinum FACHB-4101]MTF40719.1 CRISPR-associated endonuclease Cas2 [Cyanobacterium aponinum 0216]WPF90201.1 CRISPR-associated endonuclease Cas2 [Cyanobacterium aponinum AL20115]